MKRPSLRLLAGLMVAAAAGGLVVGTPADETIAAFVDREFASGVFSAHTWNVQGSTDTSIWADHFTTSNVAIFQPAIGDVNPGGTRSYSRFGIRLARGSTIAGTVTMSAGAQVNGTTQAEKFRMRVVRSGSTTCDSTSFGATSTYIVGSHGTGTTNFGNMLTSPNTNGTFTLQPGTETNAGQPVYLCFEFSLSNPPPAGLSNGTAATVQWTFNAESVTS